MKLHSIVTVLPLAWFCGCSDTKRAEPLAQVVEAAPPAAVELTALKIEPLVPVVPDPVPEPEPEPPAPPPKPSAGSIVWAAARISVTQEEGIFAVPAGTRLRIVAVTPDGYLVTDEKREFAVRENQVAMERAMPVVFSPADEKARQKALQQERDRIARLTEQAATADRFREMQTRYELLVKEEAQLNAQLARGQNRVYPRTISQAQMNAWEARLPIVQGEVTRLAFEMKRIRP
jgi:hypothetical protein